MKQTPEKPRVFLAMPHYTAHIHMAAAQAFFTSYTVGGVRVVRQQTWGGSLLAKSFNMLWAMALASNEKDECEWFAMLHADIGPEGGWVDKLIEEAIVNDADVVSACIPLKNAKGLTSTGIDDPDDEFQPLRRLTMREVHSQMVPLTFSAADLGQPDHALLVNTGCFVARLDRPWCRATDQRGHLLSTFSIDDRIKRIDGVWNVGVSPEDWRWSRMLHRAGAKVMATKKVVANHFGETGYRNDAAWGQYRNDEETQNVWQSKGCRIITDDAEQYAI